MQIGESIILDYVDKPTALILRGKLDAEILDVAKKRNVETLVVRDASAWSKEYARELSGIISEMRIEDLAIGNEIALDFENLRALEICETPNSGFLNNFPYLIRCSIDNVKEFPEGILSLSKLRSLTFGDGCSFKKIPHLATLTCLEQLSFSAARLSLPLRLSGLSRLVELGVSNYKGLNMEFVDGLQALEVLWLSRASKLTTLSGISACGELRDVNFSSCAKLTDITAIASLEMLHRIVFDSCPSIASIRPLKDLRQLRKLLLWETTKIADGDVDFLRNIRTLEVLQMKDRRSYNASKKNIEQGRKPVVRTGEIGNT